MQAPSKAPPARSGCKVADFEMKAGARSKNINGRAVYADGGSVSVGGTISGITDNTDMWQSRNGCAIHLRGENASAVLTSTAVVENIFGSDSMNSSAIYVTGADNHFLTEKGSTIRKLTQTIGVNCVSNKNTKLNGEITEEAVPSHSVWTPPTLFLVKMASSTRMSLLLTGRPTFITVQI